MLCLGFVFSAVLELAILLMLPIANKANKEEEFGREAGRKPNGPKKFQAKVASQITEGSISAMAGFSTEQILKFTATQKRLDNIACVTYGILFTVCNLIYWIYYFF